MQLIVGTIWLVETSCLYDKDDDDDDACDCADELVGIGDDDSDDHGNDDGDDDDDDDDNDHDDDDDDGGGDNYDDGGGDGGGGCDDDDDGGGSSDDDDDDYDDGDDEDDNDDDDDGDGSGNDDNGGDGMCGSVSSLANKSLAQSSFDEQEPPFCRTFQLFVIQDVWMAANASGPTCVPARSDSLVKPASRKVRKRFIILRKKNTHNSGSAVIVQSDKFTCGFPDWSDAILELDMYWQSGMLSAYGRFCTTKNGVSAGVGYYLLRGSVTQPWATKMTSKVTNGSDVKSDQRKWRKNVFILFYFISFAIKNNETI